ncbi:MAG: hypothetical protein ACPG4Z_01045 [Chitinophagales bacterium]
MTDKVLKDISTIEQLIDKGDIENKEVSQKGTYWQLEHSLKVLKAIAKLLIASKPEEYNPKFSLAKWVILISGKIPRGKGRAPKKTISQEEDNITVEKLKSRVDELRELMKTVKTLPHDSFFPHPLFKDVKYKWAVRFMSIHTRHHLAIIDDIMKK